jgi:hypothetical protein
MDGWASMICQSGFDVLEMLEIGLGVKEGSLMEYAKDGNHLLAPTGSDLSKHNKLNTVLAGIVCNRISL